MEEIMNNLKTLWNYLCLNTNPSKSECIIGLGSILTMVPKKCAELYNDNLGDYIIFSGNCGKGTKGVISITEAERFKNIAVGYNVPEYKVLLEPDATTTYENYIYIKKVLDKNGLNPDSFLIVGKPYQERRALLIANVELAGKKYEVASHNITLEEYIEFVKNDEFMNVEDIVNEMIGEISLILKIPEYGFQSKENVPTEVLDSFSRIVAAGYDKYYYSDDHIRNIYESMVKKRININKKEFFMGKDNYLLVHGSFGSPFVNWLPWLRSELEKENLKMERIS